jgi:hypothetical protein
MESSQFTCSICGDASRDICVYCTKDTCPNHICERCLRCSDCCLCGVTRRNGEAEKAQPNAGTSHSVPVAAADPSDPEPDFQPL